ncbi:MAG: hypothetical protein QOD39_3829, partial [Mycobacterium sp.]|nr:hypothetical protein [Mycobacterium sp.]
DHHDYDNHDDHHNDDHHNDDNDYAADHHDNDNDETADDDHDLGGGVGAGAGNDHLAVTPWRHRRQIR